jgi:hypothetical protein
MQRQMPYSNDGEHYFVEVISDKYGDTLVIYAHIGDPLSLLILIFSPFKLQSKKSKNPILE